MNEKYEEEKCHYYFVWKQATRHWIYVQHPEWTECERDQYFIKLRTILEKEGLFE